MIIERSAEVQMINGTKKWTLVYGRRKTGKSFLVDKFTQWNEYFFVKKDRGIIRKGNNETLGYEAFLQLLRSGLGHGDTIIVDEFQRLGEDFLDILHSMDKQGRLILISSTLFLSSKMLASKSPLLGLVAEVQVCLVDLKDCIKSLQGYGLEKKQMVESAVIFREPLAIDYVGDKFDAENFANLLISAVKTVPSLIGEVFTEEQRTTSGIYEGILRAVANGKTVSSDISSYLFSHKLVDKDDPSTIQRHLSNLVEFGILKKLQVFERNRYIYRHVSPLAWLFYYADEKYNISERKIAGVEIRRIANELLPHIMEDQLREFIAQEKGLVETVVQEKEFGVDGLLLRFKKPEIALEVKWKKNVDEKDVAEAEENLARISAKQKWLVVPDKKLVKIKTKLKVVDITDFI